MLHTPPGNNSFFGGKAGTGQANGRTNFQDLLVCVFLLPLSEDFWDSRSCALWRKFTGHSNLNSNQPCSPLMLRLSKQRKSRYETLMHVRNGYRNAAQGSRPPGKTALLVRAPRLVWGIGLFLRVPSAPRASETAFMQGGHERACGYGSIKASSENTRSERCFAKAMRKKRPPREPSAASFSAVLQ